jgi:YD repeat-containing protein
MRACVPRSATRSAGGGKTISFTYDRDDRKTAEYDTTGGAAQTGASELASWTWDTLAKGQLTSAVAYTGGTGGTSYTQQVLGYTSAGQSKGTQTTISAGPLMPPASSVALEAYLATPCGRPARRRSPARADPGPRLGGAR